MKRHVLALLVFSSLCVSSAAPTRTVRDHWNALNMNAGRAIETLDLKNDYIAYRINMAEGFGEFAVWRRRGAPELIGDAINTCGPECSLSNLRFLEPNGNVYVDVTTRTLAGIVQGTRFSAAIERTLAARFAARSGERAQDYGYFVLLPRYGTTIRICNGFGSCDLELGQLMFNGKGFTFR
jgi:hypothetical protein